MFDFRNVSSTKKEFGYEYLFLFASAIPAMTGLNGLSIKVYLYLVAEHEPGKLISITKGDKNKIIEYLGKGSTKSIANSLTELCKYGLLTRVENNQGSYIINPGHAWKGALTKRDKILKRKTL